MLCEKWLISVECYGDNGVLNKLIYYNLVSLEGVAEVFLKCVKKGEEEGRGRRSGGGGGENNS